MTSPVSTFRNTAHVADGSLALIIVVNAWFRNDLRDVLKSANTWQPCSLSDELAIRPARCVAPAPHSTRFFGRSDSLAVIFEIFGGR